jgi:SNF family Na+-dependent transporter
MADPRRAELDSIQAKLASRKSISHFARAAVAIMWALICAGAFGKMLWDVKLELIDFATPAAMVAAVLLSYGIVHWLLGRRELAKELELFTTVKRLREQLRLDDPEALLPR